MKMRLTRPQIRAMLVKTAGYAGQGPYDCWQDEDTNTVNLHVYNVIYRIMKDGTVTPDNVYYETPGQIFRALDEEVMR
jgi:hypothetical protein